ncbi:O-methyltransferase [Pseudomonas sp. H11T01]|uniref:O-methyltransferase n=1 Tax=Pseudomonas sp. H11T01 TaxID=3402749 RepID=UPI003AD0DCB0
MSAGGNIPYHLRQNKAIERNLFVDMLTRVGRYCNISDFRYIGFGGPFLEDFKHLHSALRISDMISLEMDTNVYRRQQFNRPISCIELRNESSDEFLSNYEFDSNKNAIVWFDYATTQIGSQLAELQQLVEKLAHGDIFKITVNASPVSLGCSNAGAKILEQRAAVAVNRFGEYGPGDILPDDVSTKKYPSLLLRALINSAKKGLSGDSGVVLYPLSAFSYSDGQQMLTFSGILLHEDEIGVFEDQTRLRSWPFFNECNEDPKSISVPALSAKERVYVESLLPGATADQILHDLDYYVGADQNVAKAEMSNFISFYRLFPWYSRIVL